MTCQNVGNFQHAWKNSLKTYENAKTLIESIIPCKRVLDCRNKGVGLCLSICSSQSTLGWEGVGNGVAL